MKMLANDVLASIYAVLEPSDRNSDRKLKEFVCAIKLATNEEAVMSDNQAAILNSLIKKHCEGEPGITDAVNVATWINSCR